MLFLARKNLFQEKTRLLISIGGVAFSVLLIMILIGLYQGWNYKMGEYIRTIPADLWVEQAGGKDMFHSVSILPASAEENIQKIEGVEKVKAFSGRRVALEHNGREIIIYLVGYDERTGAGPVRIVDGKSTPGSKEVIIDKKIANENKLKVGDKIEIGDIEFAIAGIAEGGDVVTLSYAFIDATEAKQLFRLPNIVNYYIVETKNGADKAQIASAIETLVQGSKVVTKDKFVEDNTELIRETFLPIIYVLVLIGIAVGIAFIGLTIFTSTVEKAKEYGVLKAIGMSNSQLYGIVIKQSLIAGFIGFMLGFGLTVLIAQIAGRFVPEFVSLIRAYDVTWIFLLTIFMAVIAAYMPVRRIAKIDPAEVFKA